MYVVEVVNLCGRTAHYTTRPFVFRVKENITRKNYKVISGYLKNQRYQMYSIIFSL